MATEGAVAANRAVGLKGDHPLWSRIIKNPDLNTGPLACSFAHNAHSSACSTLLASLARSAALTYSLARGTVNDKMAIFSVFFFQFCPTVN